MKVYYHPPNNIFGYNSHQQLIPFHYEKDKFVFVDQVEQADIIPMSYTRLPVEQREEFIRLISTLNINKNQLIVFLDVYHSSDRTGAAYFYQEDLEYYKNNQLNAVIVHCNHKINTPNLIYYDHMWNRQKVYFTDYDSYDLSNRLWTFNSTKKMFELNEITNKKLVKKFLIANKTYKHNFLLDKTGIDESDSPRSIARVILEKAVLEQDCYYSNPNNYIFLEPQETSMVQDEHFSNHFLNMGVGFNPIANKYYDTSGISVYVETLASSQSSQGLVSEKTYNPLIKGHFIIPFSYPGIIKDLKELYGFRFPDWIDYSYDEIQDDNDRFHEFMKSFSRVRFMSLEELENKCNSDIEILKHNRQVFFDRPYNSLYDSLQKVINTLN